MSRLIDADALKYKLQTYFSLEDGGTAMQIAAIRAVDSAPTVAKDINVLGWISVKDRMPETNDEVLTTYLYDDKPKKRYVETASYFDDGEGEGHWHSVWDEFSIGPVRKTTIAWMPMPKPYKPSKEEAEDDAAGGR